MKKLFLIRHAKSSWIDDALPDLERPLNSRGRENAPLMAQIASKKWNRPELVLCSPAKRAIQTSEFFKEEWWKEANNKICSELYEGSPSIILDLLSSVADEIHSVVAVFHNPNITILTNLLAQQNISNVPTCGVVTLEFPEIQWRKLEVGSCSLEDYDYPKKNS